MHIAIPAMNEAKHLPLTLQGLLTQPLKDTKIWICVNQPDHWWHDNEKVLICEDNQQTLNYLNSLSISDLYIIDCSSKGKGWQGKNLGVGQARKVIMDTINQNADPGDIILSLDADTLLDEGYLDSVRMLFSKYPSAAGLSNPYYHHLTGNEQLDRAMLRYEIYMRHYAINMCMIGSPYGFTALGSAIAMPVWAYRKIGGMSPKKSGEDFYLLQKLRKTGWLINYNNKLVFPATRYSDRVFFGTGPALIKGSRGNWESYPVYHHGLFNNVKSTYEMFPELFRFTVETPMTEFLNSQLACQDIFQSLRENCSSAVQFIKACHNRVDGLRILQYLKWSQKQLSGSDEQNLREFFAYFFQEEAYLLINRIQELNGSCNFSESKLNHAYKTLLGLVRDKNSRDSFFKLLDSLDFQRSSIEMLDFIRNLDLAIEISYHQINLLNGSCN
jgi:hypothetical protein